jgi:hypothetical protein
MFRQHEKARQRRGGTKGEREMEMEVEDQAGVLGCSEPSEVTAYEPEALVRKCVWVGWMWFYHHGRKDLIIHK